MPAIAILIFPCVHMDVFAEANSFLPPEQR